MNTDELNRLLKSKTWRAEFMACDDNKLRIFLQDLDSGDCGLLAIEPVQLALPDERALEYSWQDISAELGPPPSEQLKNNCGTTPATAYLSRTTQGTTRNRVYRHHKVRCRRVECRLWAKRGI